MVSVYVPAQLDLCVCVDIASDTAITNIKHFLLYEYFNTFIQEESIEDIHHIPICFLEYITWLFSSK